MPFIDPHSIDALLPQTQCTQCGYPGCMPYAEAIAAGAASINQCAPGGDDGIFALARLTGIAYAPLDPAHGVHKARTIAVIDEGRCIGCTICIQKCPVDAIAGATKLMHTVIAGECTGCELCVEPCPVDCIELIPAPARHPAIGDRRAAVDAARARHLARRERLAVAARLALERRAEGRNAHTAGHPVTRQSDPGAEASGVVGSAAQKRDAIAAALERARARRGALAR